MVRVASKTWRVFVAVGAALCLATSVAAQATQTKETVPAGPASVKSLQVKGQLVATGSNWLIAKDPAGYYKIYGVKEGIVMSRQSVESSLELSLVDDVSLRLQRHVKLVPSLGLGVVPRDDRQVR